MMEENKQSAEEHKSEMVLPVGSVEHIITEPINANRDANANCNNKSRQNNVVANVNNKNRRRRKRSYRSRKNSKCYKFNNCMKRDFLFNRDQARRHQLFFTDSQPNLVPYNTNEFLMEDHYPKCSPNFNYNPSNSHDSLSSSERGSASFDEDEFLTKEFCMDYENFRSEHLHEMSKEQLIEEYLKLENQTEKSMKEKEDQILALNNKIKGKLLERIGRYLYVKFLFPSLPLNRIDTSFEASEG